MSNVTKISDYYAVLDDKHNVMNLVIFPGIATSPSYYNLSEDVYNKVHNFLLQERLGVNIAPDGTITTYDLPAPPKPPLKDQAQSALSDVQSQAPMIVAMGESFGPKTKAYVQALQAIINGTDTTSTEMPVKPDALTE